MNLTSSMPSSREWTCCSTTTLAMVGLPLLTRTPGAVLLVEQPLGEVTFVLGRQRSHLRLCARIFDYKPRRSRQVSQPDSRWIGGGQAPFRLRGLAWGR